MTSTAHGQMRYPGAAITYIAGSVGGNGQEIAPYSKDELAEAIALKLKSSSLVFRSLLQYYASVDGGNVAFNASASATSVPSAGAIVAIFHNPANSVTDLYLARLVISADNTGSFQRYRATTTVTVTGAASVIANRGGGEAIAKGKVYGYNQASIPSSSATPTKTIRVSSSADEPDDINGSIILRPGEVMYWRYKPASGNVSSNCDIEIVWWELAART